MAQDLSGKVCIITGGANGLGRKTAEVWSEAGARVVVADVDELQGSDLAARLGQSCRFMRTDVSRIDEVQALLDYTVSEYGGLDVMFNNAGMSDNAFGRLLDQDFSIFDQIMRVNLLGVMLGTQIAARHMAKHGGGSIINTASIAGVLNGHGFPMYRSAKAGIIHFTKSAALELGEYLVRVNCLCPGNIPTGMGKFADPQPGISAETNLRMQDAVAAVRMSRQPLKRQGMLDDLGEAALFLASDRSRYITGQILSVDGGASLGSTRSQIGEIMEVRAEALKG